MKNLGEMYSLLERCSYVFGRCFSFTVSYVTIEQPNVNTLLYSIHIEESDTIVHSY